MICANCGGPLKSVRHPFTPPWVCNGCHIGWWNAELTAVRSWRSRYRDFGADTATVRAAVKAERS